MYVGRCRATHSIGKRVFSDNPYLGRGICPLEEKRVLKNKNIVWRFTRQARTTYTLVPDESTVLNEEKIGSQTWLPDVLFPSHVFYLSEFAYMKSHHLSTVC